jgi:hypothetical protein
LKDVVDWAEHYRRRWDERLDRLDVHLARMQKKKGATHHDRKRQR